MLSTVNLRSLTKRRIILQQGWSVFCPSQRPTARISSSSLHRLASTVQPDIKTKNLRVSAQDQESKPDEDMGKTLDHKTRNKSAVPRDSLYRLVELSRQEWKLIALSASTLAVTSSITLVLPFASGQVIDYTITSADDGFSPMLLAGGLFGLTTLAGTGVYLRSLWLARAGNRIVARLKQQLYGSLLKQESAFLDRQTTGDLLSRLSADAQMIQSAVTSQAVSGLRGVVMSIGSASMLVYTSPTLALVSCCTLPPIFIATRQVGRKLQTHQEQVQKLQGEAGSLAEQSLSNISTVKQFVAEEYESMRYHNAISQAHNKALETAHMQAQLEAGAHVAGNGAVLCVLGYGGSLVLDGAISAGDLTGFVMYSLLMAGNLSGLTSLYGDLSRAVAASNRVFDILDRQPEIRSDFGSPSVPSLEEISSQRDSLQLKKGLSRVHNNEQTQDASEPVSVIFDSVNFSYPTRSNVNVLQDFNLEISPGESIALVGGSGSGKSTVASLLTRLYDVNQKNSIRINGRPVCELDLVQLRRMIGVVPQDPALFRGTIRENIVYGEWEYAKEDRVLEASRLARVHDFTKDLPDGLDTQVGPRGYQLSGGQRQRIVLARMLVKSPPLVIFDEATSALDARSEYHVQQAMNTVISSGQRTVISIAHRLSTIRNADRIAVLSKGAIVQTGTFNELSSTEGPFQELMKTQLVGSSSPRTS